MADAKKSGSTKPAGAVPPKTATPAPSAKATEAAAATAPPAAPAGNPPDSLHPADPQAGRTFKRLDAAPISPTQPAKRGPGRPKKEPAKGDAPAKVGAERPGLASARPGPTPPHSDVDLTEKAARGILAACGYIEGAIAGMILKVDLADAIQIWKFSPVELDLVSGPATKVLNKYEPEWLIKWHDEIELAGILGPIMLNKVIAMLALKNPELLARFAAAAMGGEHTRETQTVATAPARPQPVPMKRPADAPRTEPARPETIDAPAETKAPPDETAPAGLEGGLDLDFLAGAADPLTEVRPSA